MCGPQGILSLGSLPQCGHARGSGWQLGRKGSARRSLPVRPDGSFRPFLRSLACHLRLAAAPAASEGVLVARGGALAGRPHFGMGAWPTMAARSFSGIGAESLTTEWLTVPSGCWNSILWSLAWKRTHMLKYMSLSRLASR